jgi:very-short-patch-repair endonuclease
MSKGDAPLAQANVASYDVIKLSAEVTIYKLPYHDDVSKAKKFDFRVIYIDKEKAYYFCAVDLAHALRYAKPHSKQHGNFKRSNPGLDEYHTKTLVKDWHKPNGLRCYDIEGLELCLQTCSKSTQVERFVTQFSQRYKLLRDLDIGRRKYKHKVRSEDIWLSAIESATYRFASQRQYPIASNRYRLDLYFPKQRVVVECDEGGHSGYNKDDEATRTTATEKELGKGVTWVRFNPNDVAGTSVERVIGNVLHALYTAVKWSS